MPNLLKANIWKAGIFKQAKYIISQPVESIPIIRITETGTILKGYYPASLGFCRNPDEPERPAWIVRHELMIGIKDEDGNVSDEKYLVITDRSYKPLDVFGRLGKKDSDNFLDLEDLAAENHDKAFNRIQRDNAANNSQTMTSITQLNLIIAGILVAIKLIGGMIG